MLSSLIELSLYTSSQPSQNSSNNSVLIKCPEVRVDQISPTPQINSAGTPRIFEAISGLSKKRLAVFLAEKYCVIQILKGLFRIETLYIPVICCTVSRISWHIYIQPHLPAKLSLDDFFLLGNAQFFSFARTTVPFDI